MKDRHPGYGIPSNGRYRAHAYRIEEPRPLSRQDIAETLLLIPAAIGLAFGLWAICVVIASVLA